MARVLLLDDDADSAEYVTFLLAQEGHEVRLPGGVTEAQDVLAHWPPTIVLVDALHGWQTYGALLRAYLEQAAQPIPIHVYATEPGVTQLVHQPGMAGRMAPLFDAAALLTTVRRHG